jgi:hypothetical protein
VGIANVMESGENRIMVGRDVEVMAVPFAEPIRTLIHSQMSVIMFTSKPYMSTQTPNAANPTVKRRILTIQLERFGRGVGERF